MRTLSKVLAALVLVSLVGCAAINPIKHANSLEQKSYALYGTFVVFEEQAGKLMVDGRTPDAVKLQIQNMDKYAKPVVDSMLEAANIMVDVRAEIKAGATDSQKLKIAAMNLSNWYYDAKPRVEALVKAVQGAK